MKSDLQPMKCLWVDINSGQERELETTLPMINPEGGGEEVAIHGNFSWFSSIFFFKHLQML